MEHELRGSDVIAKWPVPEMKLATGSAVDLLCMAGIMHAENIFGNFFRGNVFWV